MKLVRNLLTVLSVLMALLLSGCGSTATNTTENALDTESDIKYATNFNISFYDDGSRLLTICDDEKIFVLGKGAGQSEYASDDMIVIEEPSEGIYLVNTAAMDFFDKLGMMDTLGFASLEADDWYVPGASDYMNEGKILYAGKYSAPDYELLLSKGCSLVIENTMISHSPEIKEKLEGMGFPVIIDRSSTEISPLARAEWIKFYGALLGCYEESVTIFDEIDKNYNAFVQNASGKEGEISCIIFCFTANGSVNVKKDNDYAAKILQDVGFSYVYENENESGTTSKTIQFESFYEIARNADVLIYNQNLDPSVSNIETLIGKNNLLAEFKAVQNNNVYSIDANLFQKPTECAGFMNDAAALYSGNMEDGTYIFRLK